MEKFPFKNGLAESDISDKHIGSGILNEIEGHPGKVVRSEGFESLSKRYPEKAPEEIAHIVKGLFGEFEERCGVTVPVDFVISNGRDGKPCLYAITEKIDGENLGEITMNEEVSKRTERLYESIAEYYLGKTPSDEADYFLADINNPTQYVYGKRPSSNDPDLFLVDTDPHINNEPESFYHAVAWLIRHMGSMESKSGKRFSEARLSIEKILAAPLPDGMSAEKAARINKVRKEAGNFLAGIFPEKSDHMPTGIR